MPGKQITLSEHDELSKTTIKLEQAATLLFQMYSDFFDGSAPKNEVEAYHFATCYNTISSLFDLAAGIVGDCANDFERITKDLWNSEVIQ